MMKVLFVKWFQFLWKANATLTDEPFLVRFFWEHFEDKDSSAYRYWSANVEQKYNGCSPARHIIVISLNENQSDTNAEENDNEDYPDFRENTLEFACPICISYFLIQAPFFKFELLKLYHSIRFCPLDFGLVNMTDNFLIFVCYDDGSSTVGTENTFTPFLNRKICAAFWAFYRGEFYSHSQPPHFCYI